MMRGVEPDEPREVLGQAAAVAHLDGLPGKVFCHQRAAVLRAGIVNTIHPFCLVEGAFDHIEHLVANPVTWNDHCDPW